MGFREITWTPVRTGWMADIYEAVTSIQQRNDDAFNSSGSGGGCGAEGYSWEVFRWQNQQTSWSTAGRGCGGGGVYNASHISLLVNKMNVGVIFPNKKQKKVAGVGRWGGGWFNQPWTHWASDVMGRAKYSRPFNRRICSPTDWFVWTLHNLETSVYS